MTSISHTAALTSSPLLGGGVLQRARIASGLILFTFVFFHFINHALGLISLDMMETFQAQRTAVTRSLLGTVVLAGALVFHLGLNLYKIAKRSTWKMPAWEAVQILLGLSIPVLLASHAAFMRAQHEIDGSDTTYFEALPGLWNDLALQQAVLLLIVWTHGCIGLHFWLRLSRFYRPFAPFLLSLAVLIPTLALCGFMVAGREVAAIAAEIEAAMAAAGEPALVIDGTANDEPELLTARAVQSYAIWTAWALLAAVPIAWVVRGLARIRHRRIRISYTDGPSITTTAGPTLLELSRMSGIPHTSICGGRARCSTCRVRVEEGAGNLPAPSDAEAATLARIKADDGVRLACQVRPETDLKVTRLVRPAAHRRALLPGASEEAGVERTLAILFLDIRGFTTLSEARLPYDTVFLLNRFFAEVGEAVTGAGGWVDKYMGDGMMALFGLNQPTPAACRAALRAAMEIDGVLEKLNHDLGAELAAPLKIGIGLHVGPLVLGRIGHRASASTTVIGPSVNVASRLESLTKDHGVQLIVSKPLAIQAGLPGDLFPEISVTVRGTSEPVCVLLVPRGQNLAPYIETDKRDAA
jgi:adenylate cyclase